MPGGRPRTVSLPPDEMIELGKEMIKWIMDNPDIIHLTQWWSLHKEFKESDWDVMKDAPEFSPYYKRALHLIGLKYLTKDSKIRDNVVPRWQRVYFKDLRNSEDADLDAEAERSKKVAEVTIPPREYIIQLEQDNMRLQHRNTELEEHANKC